MILRALACVMAPALAALLLGAGSLPAAAIPWPPPRSPAEIARAESLASVVAPIPAKPPRPPTRKGLAVSLLGDEVRFALVVFDATSGRTVIRAPLLGTTILLGSEHEGIGRVGLLGAAESGTLMALGLGMVALAQDGMAGIGAIVLMAPVMLASNSQVGWVIAGPHGDRARSGPALSVFGETRTDVFAPPRNAPWLRWEPGAGIGLDLPFGTGDAPRRSSVVVQAGLGARVDWMAGGRLERRHPRPFVEVQLEAWRWF